MRTSRVVWSWLGAAVALAVAITLFTRFSLDDSLRRDEAIYAYGGQQLAAGVPVYAGIFDPKTPLAQALAGMGAALAPGRGAGDVEAIRLVFFAFACLSVVAVYALGLALWGSIPAALLGAVVFASFRSFALDALGGPDAKTPGVLFAVLSLLLMLRRRWWWAGVAASLAALVWQPFAVYVVVAVAAAAVAARWEGVGRALAGAAVPLVAVVAWLSLAGSLPAAAEATVEYPLHGVERVPETLGARVGHIAGEVGFGYGVAGGLLLAAGLVLILLRGRRAWVVVASLLALVAFSLHDFEGTADVFPFLPYAAVGIAGAVALARGRVAAACSVLAIAAVFGATWVAYSAPQARSTDLLRQRARAGAVERLLDRGEHFEALGDPTALVLTGRRDPTPFVYLSEGVGDWALRHRLGGFEGFAAGLRARQPAVVVVDAWHGALARRTEHWLRGRYDRECLGDWQLFLAPLVLPRAARRGVALRPPGHLGCLRPGPTRRGPAGRSAAPREWPRAASAPPGR